MIISSFILDSASVAIATSVVDRFLTSFRIRKNQNFKIKTACSKMTSIYLLLQHYIIRYCFHQTVNRESNHIYSLNINQTLIIKTKYGNFDFFFCQRVKQFLRWTVLYVLSILQESFNYTNLKFLVWLDQESNPGPPRHGANAQNLLRDYRCWLESQAHKLEQRKGSCSFFSWFVMTCKHYPNYLLGGK